VLFPEMIPALSVKITGTQRRTHHGMCIVLQLVKSIIRDEATSNSEKIKLVALSILSCAWLQTSVSQLVQHKILLTFLGLAQRCA